MEKMMTYKQEQRKPLVFLRSVSPYNAGEVAGFFKRRYDQLIDSGAAKPYDPNPAKAVAGQSSDEDGEAKAGKAKQTKPAKSKKTK